MRVNEKNVDFPLDDPLASFSLFPWKNSSHVIVECYSRHFNFDLVSGGRESFELNRTMRKEDQKGRPEWKTRMEEGHNAMDRMKEKQVESKDVPLERK